MNLPSVKLSSFEVMWGANHFIQGKSKASVKHKTLIVR